MEEDHTWWPSCSRWRRPPLLRPRPQTQRRGTHLRARHDERGLQQRRLGEAAATCDCSDDVIDLLSRAYERCWKAAAPRGSSQRPRRRKLKLVFKLSHLPPDQHHHRAPPPSPFPDSFEGEEQRDSSGGEDPVAPGCRSKCCFPDVSAHVPDARAWYVLPAGRGWLRVQECMHTGESVHGGNGGYALNTFIPLTYNIPTQREQDLFSVS